MIIPFPYGPPGRTLAHVMLDQGHWRHTILPSYQSGWPRAPMKSPRPPAPPRRP